VIAGREFRSRLIVGTGKYPSFQVMKEAHEASGADMVTVAVRRVDLGARGPENLLDHIDPKRYFLLPNTAACYTVDEALRTARLGREAGLSNWVKLEVIGDEKTLYPDTEGLLAATRVLAAWMVLPFIYMASIGVGYLASYLAVVQQIGEVSQGGYALIFWMFQNPPDFFYSVIKGMTMATAIVAVGCYYGYNASGGPVGVGQATAKSMILNMVLVHLIGMMGSQIFWGANPRAPIGG